MIFYCKHKKGVIVRGKVINYCLKRNCWALMMFSGKTKLAQFMRKDRACKSLKKGL